MIGHEQTAEAARQGSYDVLAPEYYDPVLHPTCANFRDASRVILSEWLRATLPADRIVEVGAGKSLVAQIACPDCYGELLLVDSSYGMLAYSAAFESATVRLICGDAAFLPISNSSVDVVVAALGDPYNTLEFWREVARILRPHGSVLFTSPSFEWVSAFRSSGDSQSAEFALADGQVLLTPSFVLPPESQAKVIRQAGLSAIHSESLAIRCLRAPISPKLLQYPDAAAITAFTAQKLP